MTAATQQTGRTKDKLTGLGNYQAFMTVCIDELAKTEENGQDLSIALVDIDHFNAVNKKKGHIVGDEVIKILGQHIASSIAQHGTVFRYGGEEFAILLPNIEKEQTFLLLEQARSAFKHEHHIKINQKEIRLKLTFSTGISSHPEDGNRVQDIIRKAEGELYRAKETGRDKVCLSREEKMVTKTSHYTQDQLERLSKLAKSEGVGEAVLLREGLDGLLKKYDDQMASSLSS